MNPDSLKISVVTVCYNAVDTLEETMLSVLNQTYPNIEYIVIDGGSTDGTVDIIKKYADRLAYWISEPDKGIYDAMNKGIAAATGDYIINMNVGDKLLLIPLERLKSELSTDCVALCGAVVNEKNLVFHPSYGWKMKLQNQLPHQGLFYKLPAIRNYNLKFKIVGDYDLNLELYLLKKKIILIDDIIALHSNDGISSTNKSAHESFKVIYHQCGFLYLALSYFYRKYKAIQKRMTND